MGKLLKSKKIAIGILVFMLVSEALLTGYLPHSKGYLFHLLESKDMLIWGAIGIYFMNFFLLDFCQAIKGFLVTRVSLLFRTDRTKEVMSKKHKKISNAPQRIQEDIKLSYHSRFTVWCEYLVSGIILIQLLVLNLEVPLLILASLAYAAFSVFLAMLFNPKLTAAEKEVQQAEANFRTSLITKPGLLLLPLANKATMFAAGVRTKYLLFTRLQLGLLQVLPYIILIPSLFSGAIDLGTLMKHQATFALIVVNAAILIQYYTVLIQGRASEERVKELIDDE